jgi:hypothetical protein
MFSDSLQLADINERCRHFRVVPLRTFGRRWTCVPLAITSVIFAQREPFMKLHANAQTCPHCRSLIVSRVLDGQMAASVARDFRVSTKTVFKWITRFRAEGSVGLDDRSSRPHRIARRYLQPGKPLSDAVFALLHTPPVIAASIERLGD